MLRSFMFLFPARGRQVGYSIMPYLLDWGFGVWGAVSKQFGCKVVDDKEGVLNV